MVCVKHSRVVGPFLWFGKLDVSQDLDGVLCLGYRFGDDSKERFTVWVNKSIGWDYGKKEASRAKPEGAVTALRNAVLCVPFLEVPVLVVPILGSDDTTAQESAVVTRLSAAIGKNSGYEHCTKLLSKDKHRSLHGMTAGSAARDAEISGKYGSGGIDATVGRPISCVVLVDDVVTRGSTMNDAARAIRDANNGSRISIYGVALAKHTYKRCGGTDHAEKLRATYSHLFKENG